MEHNFPQKTMNLDSSLPQLTSESFSISRSGKTFNFRMDIQLATDEPPCSNPFELTSTGVKERATIYILGDNQGEEQPLAHYKHSYGFSTNISSFYGHMVGEQEESDKSFEFGENLNFAKSVRAHFESNWNSSSFTEKSCIIA